MANLDYVFAEFVLSPVRRQLLYQGREVALIPRYLDLLLLLVRRRQEALHRREILDLVWNDVVVSDGALSQAVRTLRRILNDDPRTPRFIRTVSRHGYQFVFTPVEERPGDGVADDGRGESPPAPGPSPVERRAAALAVLLTDTPGAGAAAARREAAEELHLLGTAAALAALGRGGGPARALSLLRDSRWDVAGAGQVPILGQPGAVLAALHLAGLRLRRAARLAGARWLTAAAAGAATGVAAGWLGAMLLYLGPGSVAGAAILVGLPLVGAVAGGLGAAGVGAGLAAAEALMRSSRSLALVFGGALGGGAVGMLAHLLARLTLEGLFGGDLSPTTGGFEGLALGGAVGLGYALAAPRSGGGMASPRGRARLLTALSAGLFCGLAAGLLAAAGRHLGAMSLEVMAHGFPGSQVRLEPLARMLGENAAGPLTRVVISSWEGLLFGTGTILGLTRRPR